MEVCTQMIAYFKRIADTVMYTPFSNHDLGAICTYPISKPVSIICHDKAKKGKFIVSQAFISNPCGMLFYFLWAGHVYATQISVITRDKKY